jgi:hypothetical protein
MDFKKSGALIFPKNSGNFKKEKEIASNQPAKAKVEENDS